MILPLQSGVYPVNIVLSVVCLAEECVPPFRGTATGALVLAVLVELREAGTPKASSTAALWSTPSADRWASVTMAALSGPRDFSWLTDSI